ncbi:MAG TPA: hypothetical protein PL064_05450, partial [Thermogutta sp.]|nr:hypothetical protein [Thermogutta sp.]
MSKTFPKVVKRRTIAREKKRRPTARTVTKMIRGTRLRRISLRGRLNGVDEGEVVEMSLRSGTDPVCKIRVMMKTANGIARSPDITHQPDSKI